MPKKYLKSVELQDNEGIKVNKGKNSVEDEHIHEFIEIVYITKGEAMHRIDDKYFLMKEGDMLFINYHQTHSFSADKETTYINILLTPEYLSKELVNNENIFDIFKLMLSGDFDTDETKIKPFIRFEGKEKEEIELVINRMLDEFEHKGYGYQLYLKGYTQIVFSMICRYMQYYEDNDSVVKGIMRYINTDYFHTNFLMDVAQKKNYSPSYFSRKFKEMYGVNFRTYVQKQRIEVAVNLLKNTDLTIEEISERVGYGDVSHFYRQFKKYANSTPKEMRIKHEK